MSVVAKAINPQNILQRRPIEDFSGVLAQLVYEKNWEATTVKQLERRIRKKLISHWKRSKTIFERKCILMVSFLLIIKCFLKNKRRAFIQKKELNSKAFNMAKI